MRKAGAFFLLCALIVAAAVPLLLGGRPAQLFTLPLSLQGYFCIFLLVVASWLLRALKQGLLLRRLGIRPGATRTLAISQATELAFLVTPGGIGGYAAGIWYLRGAGASYAAAAAVATADQLLDVMVFAAAVPFALIALADAAEIGNLREVARAGAGLLVLICTTGFLLRHKLGGWLFGSDHAPGALERLPYLRRYGATLREFVVTLREQLRTLQSGSSLFLAGLLLCTALQWITRYGVLWLILLLLGHAVPFALLFLLQGFVLHAAQWTGMPAGAGGADLGLAASLTAFAPTTTIAAALWLWRIATLYLSLAAGLLAAIALRQSSRRTLSPAWK